MGYLKGTQQSAMKQLMRGQAGNICAIQHHLAAIRLVQASNNIEQRGFTRTIRPYQTSYRSCFNCKGRIIDSVNTAK